MGSSGQTHSRKYITAHSEESAEGRASQQWFARSRLHTALTSTAHRRLSVDRPAFAVFPPEILIRLRNVRHLPRHRIVLNLLPRPISHQTQKKLLDHIPAVFKVARRLLPGAAGP